jgi:hypothetical protein
MLFEDWRSEIPDLAGLLRETEDRTSKAKSAFGSQKIVETGLVRKSGFQPQMAVYWSFRALVSCRIREGFDFGRDLGLRIS